MLDLQTSTPMNKRESGDIFVWTQTAELAESILEALRKRGDFHILAEEGATEGTVFVVTHSTRIKAKPLRIYLFLTPMRSHSHVALAVENFIRRIEPRYVFFAGEAAGMAEDCQTGDLVVADSMLAIQPVLSITKGLHQKTDVYATSSLLLSALRSFVQTEPSLIWTKKEQATLNSRVHFGSCAYSNRAVDSSAELKSERIRKILALEHGMETSECLSVASWRRTFSPEIAVLRCLTDSLHSKKISQSSGRLQTFRSCARFLTEFLFSSAFESICSASLNGFVAETSAENTKRYQELLKGLSDSLNISARNISITSEEDQLQSISSTEQEDGV